MALLTNTPALYQAHNWLILSLSQVKRGHSTRYAIAVCHKCKSKHPGLRLINFCLFWLPGSMYSTCRIDELGTEQCHTSQNKRACLDHYLMYHLSRRSLERLWICICVVVTYSRVWINRVRLPILLSQDGFDRPVPSRVSLLISTLRLNLVLIHEIPHDFRGGVHLFI